MCFHNLVKCEERCAVDESLTSRWSRQNQIAVDYCVAESPNIRSDVHYVFFIISMGFVTTRKIVHAQIWILTCILVHLVESETSFLHVFHNISSGVFFSLWANVESLQIFCGDSSSISTVVPVPLSAIENRSLLRYVPQYLVPTPCKLWGHCIVDSGKLKQGAVSRRDNCCLYRSCSAFCHHHQKIMKQTTIVQVDKYKSRRTVVHHSSGFILVSSWHHLIIMLYAATSRWETIQYDEWQYYYYDIDHYGVVSEKQIIKQSPDLNQMIVYSKVTYWYKWKEWFVMPLWFFLLLERCLYFN
jgi:hypothetical protein